MAAARCASSPPIVPRDPTEAQALSDKALVNPGAADVVGLQLRTAPTPDDDCR